MERKRAKRGHWASGKKRGPMTEEHKRRIGESVRGARVRREEFESLEAELKLLKERREQLKPLVEHQEQLKLLAEHWEQRIAELRLMVVERAERIEELEKRLDALEADYQARIESNREGYPRRRPCED